MRVLITNARLEDYAGTEVVVRDLSLELQRQGHEPVVYSPRLGAVAKEIKEQGIEVTDKLGSAKVPDVIHGHHHPQVVEALTHFSSTPAVYVCHGHQLRLEEPFYFPRILRYVAVDERCRQRIESLREIPSDRIEIIPNAVDLTRFQPRPPLPARPKNALVFSNYANNRGQLPAVRRACREIGLKLDVLGLRAGTAVGNPESVLSRYDVVFAKGRCALEAMAVGNAVVLCDFSRSGPMVTSANWDGLRSLNFGIGACVNPLRPELIRAEVERYNVADAVAVCRRVREQAGLVEATRRWIALYSSVVEEFHHSPRDFPEELRALSVYLARWSYEARVVWEWRQIEALARIPVIGSGLLDIARRFLRRRSGR